MKFIECLIEVATSIEKTRNSKVDNVEDMVYDLQRDLFSFELYSFSFYIGFEAGTLLFNRLFLDVLSSALYHCTSLRFYLGEIY